MGNNLCPPTSDTVSKCIQHLAEVIPDKELFVFYKGDIRESYTSRQVFQLAGKFARILRYHYGFKKGDVIVNTLPNSPERLLSELGVILAGCINMNGHVGLADGTEFYRTVRNSQCCAVILASADDKPIWELLRSHVVGDVTSPITKLSCHQAPTLKRAIIVSRESIGQSQPFLEELKKSTEEIFVEQSIDPDDVVQLFTTSGTTGYSKLAPRTHAEAIKLWRGISERHTYGRPGGELEVYYNDRLTGWIAGYPLGTFLCGLKRVLKDEFDSSGEGEEAWKAIEGEKCTSALILPYQVRKITAYVKETGTAHKLKVLFTGGQPLRKSQVKEMFTIAEQVMLAYGSSEGGFPAFKLLKDADTEFGDFLCGPPRPDRCVRVVDDNLVACKPGQIGTIHLKGGDVFKGYFNLHEHPDPDMVNAFTKDGWFNTGDVGTFDDDGNLYIMGRSKDIINYGAISVHPSFLEVQILKHPQVAEVCVVPVSDPMSHHLICACIKPTSGSNLTEEKLRSFIRSLFTTDPHGERTPLPRFYWFLEDFPLTSSGKPDRKFLKVMAEDKFGYRPSKPLYLHV